MRLFAAMIVALLLPMPAFAERSRSRDVPASRVRQLAREAVEEALPRGVELVTVRWTRALRMPAGPIDARASIEGEPRRGRLRAAVELSIDDDPVETIRVALRVRDARPVLVAVRELRPGDRIRPRDVEMREAPAGSRTRAPIRDDADAIGLVVARLTEAGAVLERRSVRAPAAVRRGERVRILSRAGGVVVAAQGESLEDGGVGEVVRVMCAASRRTVEARIIGPGRVEVSR